MRILVYGAGAVGCFLGGHLALAGHDVTLLGREDMVNAVSNGGLRLVLTDGAKNIGNVKAVDSLKSAVKTGPYDFIALTVKAYDTIAAIQDLEQALDQKPVIASFQNGVGNEESLRASFGDDNVTAATVTTPISVPEPGEIVEETRRGIAIASDSATSGLVHSAFASTALRVETVPSSQSLKWSKLLLNMLANVIPAIVDRMPAEVCAEPHLLGLEIAALREAVAVTRLLNVQLTNLPGMPARLLALASQLLPNFVLQPLLKNRISTGRGQKPPSLLLALRTGNKRTEVAWLNGAVAQAAKSMGRLAPLNHALALTLSDIAAGREPWDLYRQDPFRLLAIVSTAQGLQGWRYGE